MHDKKIDDNIKMQIIEIMLEFLTLNNHEFRLFLIISF